MKKRSAFKNTILLYDPMAIEYSYNSERKIDNGKNKFFKKPQSNYCHVGIGASYVLERVIRGNVWWKKMVIT